MLHSDVLMILVNITSFTCTLLLAFFLLNISELAAYTTTIRIKKLYIINNKTWLHYNIHVT